MTKYFSLTETFFKEIPFKDFLSSISDADYNHEYYTQLVMKALVMIPHIMILIKIMNIIKLVMITFFS